MPLPINDEFDCRLEITGKNLTERDDNVQRIL